MNPAMVERVLAMIENDPFTIRLIMDEINGIIDDDHIVSLGDISTILQTHGVYDAFVQKWEQIYHGEAA